MFRNSDRKLQGESFDLSETQYVSMIADALKSDLGPSHIATKTVMRWTGASERSERYWLNGEYGPGGRHLVMLAHGSDAVLKGFLALAEREHLELGLEVAAARSALARAKAIVDAIVRTD